jgi:hypothetical protein
MRSQTVADSIVGPSGLAVSAGAAYSLSELAASGRSATRTLAGHGIAPHKAPFAPRFLS